MLSCVHFCLEPTNVLSCVHLCKCVCMCMSVCVCVCVYLCLCADSTVSNHSYVTMHTSLIPKLTYKARPNYVVVI